MISSIHPLLADANMPKGIGFLSFLTVSKNLKKNKNKNKKPQKQKNQLWVWQDLLTRFHDKLVY